MLSQLCLLHLQDMFIWDVHLVNGYEKVFSPTCGDITGRVQDEGRGH